MFPFVRSLYEEVEQLFPPNNGRWIHVGGDEVQLDCWKKSPKIQAWMKQKRMNQEDELVRDFEKRLVDLVMNELHHRPIVWQETFDSGFDLPLETVVDIWKGWDFRKSLNAATKKFDVLLSAGWYLDWLGNDWIKFYDNDPAFYLQSEEQKAHVLGGHSCMWAERVDENNFFARVYPRTSAMAERLWSADDNSAKESSHERLKNFRCRMMQNLGIQVSPVSPGAPCNAGSYHWSASSPTSPAHVTKSDPGIHGSSSIWLRTDEGSPEVFAAYVALGVLVAILLCFVRIRRRRQMPVDFEPVGRLDVDDGLDSGTSTSERRASIELSRRRSVDVS